MNANPSCLPQLLLLLFLCAFSCNSPEDRLGKLRHEFWQEFARKDFFEIKLKNQVLQLPLPPQGTSEQQAGKVEKWRQEARSLEQEKLSQESREMLGQLQSALEDIGQGRAFFDPARCCIAGCLEKIKGQPDHLLFLEKIPHYYAEVESRWREPDPRFVPKAVEDSQLALDILHEMGSKSGKNMDAPKIAVKNFIGLCQSALLLR